MWADVERWDNFTLQTKESDKIVNDQSLFQRITGKFQKITAKFRWRDDPDAENYIAEDDKSEDRSDGTSRKTVVVKVCSPDEEDLNDPEEWVPIRVMSRARMKKSGEGKMTIKTLMTKLLGDGAGQRKNRKVQFRRIYHYDTNIDEKAEAAFEEDETRKAYVVKGHKYAKDDETKDDDQYIECEIVENIKKKNNAHEDSNSDDVSFLKLKNQYLIDETEDAKLEERGNNDINPPYRFDVYQNIINVNFGGIAVEFLDQSEESGGNIQSFLEALEGLPDMDRALISFWVRLPGRSVTKYKSQQPPSVPVDPTKKLNCIPVITFGQMYESYHVAEKTGTSYTVREYNYTFLYNGGACNVVISNVDDVSIYNGPRYARDDEIEAPKQRNSFIGFKIKDDDDADADLLLTIRLQTDTYGTGSNLHFRQSVKVADYQGFSSGGVEFEPFPSTVVNYCYPQNAWDDILEVCLTGVVLPGKEHKRHTNIIDDTGSELWSKKSGPDYFEPSLDIRVAKNVWHHFIISFDLTKKTKGIGTLTTQTEGAGCASLSAGTSTTNIVRTITEPCKLYIAHNDVNIKGATKLNKDHPLLADSLGDNGIAPKRAIDAAEQHNTSATGGRAYWGLTNELKIDTADPVGMPSYEYKPGKIRARGRKLGIPVFSDLVDEMFDIELAELQVFRVVRDTAGLQVRRALITDEGKPNRNYAEADALFGKPVLRLRGSGNWKKGKNTGTNGDLTKNDSGEIITYKPKPSLHGDQGEPQ